MLIITGITALVSGACNAGLIALVNTALNRPAARTALLVAGFVALGLGKIVSGFFYN